MSSTTRISRDEALAVLDEQRAQIEALSAQMLGEQQHALLPLGFPKNSDEWHKRVPPIIRRLNLEYRHDCRFDIIEGARKIGRTNVSFDELMERLAACNQMRDIISTLSSKLQTLYAIRRPRMSLPLANHFAGVMPTIAASVALVHQLVDSAKEGISTNDAVLEVMTMRKDEVRVFAMRLFVPVSPKDNILGVRPLLAQLRELHAKRTDIETKCNDLHSRLRAAFMSRTSVPASEIQAEFTKYTKLLNALEEQEISQQELLKQAKVYFDRAASSPTTVTGLWPDTSLDIAALRGAHVSYKEILESLQMMEQLYVPLRHAMICVESHVRRGVPLEMSEELFSFARFLRS